MLSFPAIFYSSMEHSWGGDVKCVTLFVIYTILYCRDQILTKFEPSVLKCEVLNTILIFWVITISVSKGRTKAHILPMSQSQLWSQQKAQQNFKQNFLDFFVDSYKRIRIIALKNVIFKP